MDNAVGDDEEEVDMDISIAACLEDTGGGARVRLGSGWQVGYFAQQLVGKSV